MKIRTRCLEFAALLLVAAFGGCEGTVDTPQTSSRVLNEFPEVVRSIRHDPVGVAVQEVPQVVQVRFSTADSFISCGTGFFVTYKGAQYLVTTKHTARFKEDLSVFNSEGSLPVVFGQVHTSQEADLIALKVIRGNVQFYSLHAPVLADVPKRDDLDPDHYAGIPVTMFGYPDSWGFRRVSGKVWYKIELFGSAAQAEYYLVSPGGRQESGMSGGPWLDAVTRQVVAVHFGSIGGKPAGVPVDYLIRLLDTFE